MRVILVRDYDELSLSAAKWVADEIRKKPESVLALPTGSTPLGMYKELIRMRRQSGLLFKKTSAFNLDEYVGLPANHPQSFAFFLWDSFLNHIDIKREKVHNIDGLAKEIPRHCEEYEAAIKRAGGLDIAILGIGRDGHIAFNEPGSSLGSRPRLKTLDSVTVRDNARFFDRLEEVPRYAITMGVATIMDARKILLLASGRNKAQAIADTIEGPITAQVTASALQFHPKVTAIVDEEAAVSLRRANYYRDVERMWDERLSE